jgi:tetratricopeptide (TPR) repeat protein
LQRAEDEDQRLALLDHALDVSPDTGEAIAARRGIWRARGERSLAAGHLQDAHEWFVRAEEVERAAEIESSIAHMKASHVRARINALVDAEDFATASELLESNRDILALILHDGVDRLHSELQEASSKALIYRDACKALETGDRTAAKRHLQQLVAMDPDYRDAYPMLGTVLVTSPRHRGLALSAAGGWLVAGIFVAIVLLHSPAEETTQSRASSVSEADNSSDSFEVEVGPLTTGLLDLEKESGPSPPPETAPGESSGLVPSPQKPMTPPQSPTPHLEPTPGESIDTPGTPFTPNRSNKPRGKRTLQAIAYSCAAKFKRVCGPSTDSEKQTGLSYLELLFTDEGILRDARPKRLPNDVSLADPTCVNKLKPCLAKLQFGSAKDFTTPALISYTFVNQ